MSTPTAPSASPYAVADEFSALDELSARPPSAATRARLLRSVAGADHRFAPFVARMAALFELDLDAAADACRRLAGDADWVPGPAPGSELLFVSGARVPSATCLRLAQGAVFPRHLHHARETTLVLSGAFEDDQGQVTRAGDLTTCPAGSVHTLTVIDGPCHVAVAGEGGMELC